MEMHAVTLIRMKKTTRRMPYRVYTSLPHTVAKM